MTEYHTADTERFLALLHNKDVLEFIQKHQHTYCYREEFMEKAMPAGLNAAFMWELMSCARRLAGRPLVMESGNKSLPLHNQSFWTATPDMITGLNDIVSRCHTLSGLSLSLERLKTRSSVQHLVLEELEAAAYRDGIYIEHESVRELLCDDRPPETPEEQLLTNALSLMHNIKSYAAQPISIEMLLNMQTLLRKDAELAQSSSPYLPPTPRMTTAPPDRSKTLASIVKGCENPCQWGPHPLFGVLMNADLIWITQPFSQFNGLMEVLIRWRSYYEIGIPALRFVPLSKMRLDWERRLVGPPEAPMRFGEALVESSFGVDSTPYIQQIISFLEAGLKRVERIVGRIDEADARCKNFIAQDGRLTLRQKQLLISMVDDPDLVIDVGSYEKRFDIATSTARNDLTNLVHLNLLLTGFHGKKQLFWPRPDLVRTLLEDTARRG